jgi:hypothetical protein
MEDFDKDLRFYGRGELPNATAVLVLGILSIVFTCMGIGCILGITGILLSREGRRLYRDHPDLYRNYGILNAGFILCIIGTSLGAFWILYFLIILGFQFFSY